MLEQPEKSRIVYLVCGCVFSLDHGALRYVPVLDRSLYW